jgi:hypothetical protein
MGLLRWLFGGPSGRGVLVGDGVFGFHVVGTLQHQNEISTMCGGRTHKGVHRECDAVLAPEPHNPYDRNAVAVSVENIRVGYLDRGVAREFLRALRASGFADVASEAMIVGGWDRGEDQGFFGLRLNAYLPFKIIAPHNVADVAKGH